MRESFFGQEELEPGPLSILAVYVSIPNVVVVLRVKLDFYLIQLVLQHRELYRYVMITPDALLIADNSVGATADYVSLGSRFSHHLHSETARWIPYLQCSVDIKTD